MIVILAGPSAVGKNFLCGEFVAHGYTFLTPLTTRAPRPGEIDGRDYEFLSLSDFQRGISEGTIGQWDFTLGNYYGTWRHQLVSAASSDECFVLHALSRMAVRMKLEFGELVWTVSLVPQDVAALEQRLIERNIEADELTRRREHIVEEVTHNSLLDQTLVVASDETSQSMYDAICESSGWRCPSEQ